ncbi:MAG: hypothetical protein KDA93_13555 [Planctomycetaceae bacterium]|nr:hypothetical protein [Planctomycetaceae bacterium]
MNSEDLRKIIGVSEKSSEYVPVAVLLKNGYACFGHYNYVLNEDLSSTIVVLNAQLTDTRSAHARNRPAIDDFREFLVEIVAAHDEGNIDELPTREEFGKSIPLIAVPMDEIAIVYPVSQIVELLGRVSDGKQRTIPQLFDLERSEILAVLRTKLW